jgi:hypothetical protein
VTDVRLAALRVPGGADAWRALGFAVVDDEIGLTNGAIRLGAHDCSFELEPWDRGVAAADGVAVSTGSRVESAVHPNGAVELDHIVITTDSIERTSAAIDDVLGLAQRRLRETDTVRQAFHRFGDAPDGTRGCIVEVVERVDVAGAAIWGVVVIVDDIDRVAAGSGGSIGTPRPAVQPGRRIASVSRKAGLSLAVAVMSR